MVKASVTLPQVSHNGVTLTRCSAAIEIRWNDDCSALMVLYRKYTRAGARLQVNAVHERALVASVARSHYNVNERCNVTFHAVA